jgi:hypothetical protein
MACLLSGPGSIPSQVVWDLRCIKWHWSRVPPSTSVSLANFHSHRILHTLLPSGVGTIGLTVADSNKTYKIVRRKKASIKQAHAPFTVADFKGIIVEPCWLFGLLVYSEDGSSTFLRNIDYLQGLHGNTTEKLALSSVTAVQSRSLTIRNGNHRIESRTTAVWAPGVSAPHLPTAASC